MALPNGNSNPHVLIKYHNLQGQNPNDLMAGLLAPGQSGSCVCVLMQALMRHKSRDSGLQSCLCEVDFISMKAG